MTHPDQPAQYPAYQLSVEPPKAKKRRKWPWVLGAVLVLVVIVTATSKGGDKSTSQANSGGSASGHADAKTAGVGDPVRDGKFEFVVTAVSPGVPEVGDNPYLAKKAQGQFIVVTLIVKNTSDKPHSFAPNDQKLRDQQGRSFQPDTGAQLALGGNGVPVFDNINPGNTVTVKLVYDMPKDATPASLELHDSAFSGGAKVSLAQ